MEVRTDGKYGSLVPSSEIAIDQFRKDTQMRQEQWKKRLCDDPDSFADMEQEIDLHYRQGAGRLVASLLAEVTQEPDLEAYVEGIRNNAAVALKSPEPRPLQVRLLCGLVLWITTLYCAPRKRPTDNEKTERVMGLYPELAAFGFGKGCSPALQYKVARLVALSPSFEIARQELRREGIELDKKTVRRIAEQLGGQLLELRRRELFQWRAGLLPAGREFAGRRVAVQIDGGRTRLREAKKGKRNGRTRKRGRGKGDKSNFSADAIIGLIPFSSFWERGCCEYLSGGTRRDSLAREMLVDRELDFRRNSSAPPQPTPLPQDAG